MSGTCNIILVVTITAVVANSKEIISSKIGNNSDVERPVDKVVLSAPVLAPPNKARAIVTETAKDFPSLLVIETDNGLHENVVKPEVVLETSHEVQPVYVKKLEEQNILTSINRRKTPTV